jgi:hypothetical protein
VLSGFPALYECVMRSVERGRLAQWRREVVRPADGDVLEVAAGKGLDFSQYRAGVTVIVTEPSLSMLARDVATPVWRRIAGGCRLNERSVDTVRCAGFRIDTVRSALRGCVVMIEATKADAGLR